VAVSGGRLVLVAGPIGNLGDMTVRVKDALTEADFWIVEDSRVSGKLQAVLGVKKRMVVLNEHTPPSKLAAIATELEEQMGAMLTDAGTPGISDPGAELVEACYEAGIPVDAMPGPSAVTMALSLSGFFAQRFAFLGFLGRKSGAIREVLDPFADSTMTLVLFESPHRYRKLLPAIFDALGSRRYAICRELTKSHQQIWRGRLPDLPTEKDVPDRGEFTIVIEGRRKQKSDEKREYNA